MSFADIDECAESTHGCDHNCSNIPGAYSCSCFHGYSLQADNKTCSGELSFKKTNMSWFTRVFVPCFQTKAISTCCLHAYIHLYILGKKCFRFVGIKFSLNLSFLHLFVSNTSGKHFSSFWIFQFYLNHNRKRKQLENAIVIGLHTHTFVVLRFK